MAIALACRLRGRRVARRLGTTAPPPRCHAWIEAAGQPLGEPVDPSLLYTDLVRT